MKQTNYGVRVAARVPHDFPDLISRAASKSYISDSAYIRQALAEKLRADGLVAESDRKSSEAAE